MAVSEGKQGCEKKSFGVENAPDYARKEGQRGGIPRAPPLAHQLSIV
jgi:hypothetical protein